MGIDQHADKSLDILLHSNAINVKEKAAVNAAYYTIDFAIADYF
jgi:hypothetical protein